MSNRYHRQYKHITVVFEDDDDADSPKRNRSKGSAFEEETYENGRKKDFDCIEIEEDKDSEQSEFGVIRFAEDEDGKEISEK